MSGSRQAKTEFNSGLRSVSLAKANEYSLAWEIGRMASPHVRVIGKAVDERDSSRLKVILHILRGQLAIGAILFVYPTRRKESYLAVH